MPTTLPNRESPDSLCDACGSRPANHFICQIVNGVKTNRSVCAECAHADTDLDLVSINQASCFYCGDKPVGGCKNQAWELPSRQQTMHYTCMRCMLLYNQFFLPALLELPSGLSPENQVQLLEAKVREADERVRQEIS